MTTTLINDVYAIHGDTYFKNSYSFDERTVEGSRWSSIMSMRRDGLNTQTLFPQFTHANVEFAVLLLLQIFITIQAAKVRTLNCLKRVHAATLSADATLDHGSVLEMWKKMDAMNTMKAYWTAHLADGLKMNQTFRKAEVAEASKMYQHFRKTEVAEKKIFLTRRFRATGRFGGVTTRKSEISDTAPGTELVAPSLAPSPPPSASETELVAPSPPPSPPATDRSHGSGTRLKLK